MKELLKEYNRMEDINDHSGAAQLLVNTFGTNEEQRTMMDIIHRHEANGFISSGDYKTRYEISNKYYKLLIQHEKEV